MITAWTPFIASAFGVSSEMIAGVVVRRAEGLGPEVLPDADVVDVLRPARDMADPS